MKSVKLQELIDRLVEARDKFKEATGTEPYIWTLNTYRKRLELCPKPKRDGMCQSTPVGSIKKYKIPEVSDL